MRKRLTEEMKAHIRAYPQHRGYLGVLAAHHGVSISAINNVLHDPRYQAQGEARRDDGPQPP